MRSGFVALAGRSNTGKSALLNRLVGAKVAITASAPQTTRTRIHGVLTRPDAQIVFIDTPGIHDPRHRLGERMLTVAREALKDADLILAIFDASGSLADEDRHVAGLIRQSGKPAVAVLNKIDRVSGEVARAREEEVRTLAPFTSVIPISVPRGTGIDRLIDEIVARLPEGPQYYPPDSITDQPEQFLVRELIREQAIVLTREELPYSIAVEVEEFAERPNDLTYIRATLHVERDSHKKILIGRGGRMLKEIGRRARAEIEKLLGRHVYLDLWVKTTKDWREREELIRTFYPDA